MCCLPSVLWRCWFGTRKFILPVRIKRRGAGMVVCVGQGVNDFAYSPADAIDHPVIWWSIKIRTSVLSDGVLTRLFWSWGCSHSARCNIYISRLCYDVRLSVTKVHWCIIANFGFKFRSQFTVHYGRGACGCEGRVHRREEWRDNLTLC